MARSWNTSSYLPTRSALALGNTPKRIAADLEKRRQKCDVGNQEENNLGWGLMQAQYFQHLDDQEQTLQRYSGQACKLAQLHPTIINPLSIHSFTMRVHVHVAHHERLRQYAPQVTTAGSVQLLWL